MGVEVVGGLLTFKLLLYLAGGKEMREVLAKQRDFGLMGIA
jgi:hypothetical protein